VRGCLGRCGAGGGCSGAASLTERPAVHTPLRSPQPARSGWRWSREGSAAGRSRRDAKRPSRDRGSWHDDRVGRASPIPRACRRGSRIPYRSHGSEQPIARRAVTGSLPPVPIQSPKGSTRPICLRTSPTMKVQVRRHINEEPQVLNHAGGVRDVLACADQWVNPRHRRARAGPASRQLLAHEAMRRACPCSVLSPVVQNAARAAAEGADPAWSPASQR
jgi:hypothetical protein